LDKQDFDIALFFLNHEHSVTNDGKIISWIPLMELEIFTELLGYNFLDEGGVGVKLQYDGIALEINEILEYFEIDEQIFIGG
jgi:hypothetical protein